MPYHIDNPIHSDSSQRVRKRLIASNVNDKINPSSIRSQSPRLLPPALRVGPVVDYMHCTQRSKPRRLLLTRRRRNNTRPCSNSHLQRGNTHPTSPLNKHPGALSHFPPLESVERIPRCDPRTRQRGSSHPLQRLGCTHKTRFREHGPGAQCPVKALAQTINRSVDPGQCVVTVRGGEWGCCECHHVVAFLKLVDRVADGFNCASAVAAWN